MGDPVLKNKEKEKKTNLLGFIFHLDHVGVTVMTLLIMQSLVYLAFNKGSLNPVARTIENFRLSDMFFEVDNEGEARDTSDLITIVDMTDVYDRGELADIINQIQACEPSVMGVDIVFNGFRNDTLGNERLVEAVCNTTSTTVWAYKLIDWNDKNAQFERTYHSFFTELVDVDHEGFINVQRDTNGGTVRTLGLHRPAEGRMEYSLSAQVAFAATNDSSIITKSKDCNIYYSSTYFPVVPSDSIAAHADQIRSHIVLLGAMRDLRDQHYTPIGKIPGVKILAYAIQTLVQRRMPIDTPYWLTVIITFMLMWLVQILQFGSIKFLKKYPEASIKYYLGDSGFVSSMISLGAIIALAFLSLLLFFHWNIYLNTAWAIMGIALLANTRKFYALLVRILSSRTKWAFLSHSLFYFKAK